MFRNEVSCKDSKKFHFQVITQLTSLCSKSPKHQIPSNAKNSPFSSKWKQESQKNNESHIQPPNHTCYNIFSLLHQEAPGSALGLWSGGHSTRPSSSPGHPLMNIIFKNFTPKRELLCTQRVANSRITHRPKPWPMNKWWVDCNKL